LEKGKGGKEVEKIKKGGGGGLREGGKTQLLREKTRHRHTIKEKMGGKKDGGQGWGKTSKWGASHLYRGKKGGELIFHEETEKKTGVSKGFVLGRFLKNRWREGKG